MRGAPDGREAPVIGSGTDLLLSIDDVVATRNSDGDPVLVAPHVRARPPESAAVPANRPCRADRNAPGGAVPRPRAFRSPPLDRRLS